MVLGGKSGQQKAGCPLKNGDSIARWKPVRVTVTNRGNARMKRTILPAAIFDRFVYPVVTGLLGRFPDEPMIRALPAFGEVIDRYFLNRIRLTSF
jgi:hypothetical protein